MDTDNYKGKTHLSQRRKDAKKSKNRNTEILKAQKKHRKNKSGSRKDGKMLRKAKPLQYKNERL